MTLEELRVSSSAILANPLSDEHDKYTARTMLLLLRRLDLAEAVCASVVEIPLSVINRIPFVAEAYGCWKDFAALESQP